ncbi:MAG: hypothetical protein J6B96_05415 [Agathobacter sp.]|nr:hypothetical protein [Agathobacter sp.]
MKRKIATMLTIVAATLIMISTSAFASSGTGIVKVGLDSRMKQAETDITRTGRYSYVMVGVGSVYPVGTYSEDTYTRCKTRIYHSDISNKVISDRYVLTEGANYKIPLYEGYLNLTRVDLCFAGNNPDLEAYVVYSYDGK